MRSFQNIITRSTISIFTVWKQKYIHTYLKNFCALYLNLEIRSFYSAIQYAAKNSATPIRNSNIF